MKCPFCWNLVVLVQASQSKQVGAYILVVVDAEEQQQLIHWLRLT